MKRITLFLLAILSIHAISAQVSFENHQFLLDSVNRNYFKGTPGVPGDYALSSNGANFMLRNDTSAFGDYWGGWAISRLKDSMSIAYDTNDCAAFPATGHNNSNVYAVAYQAFNPYYNTIRFDNPQIVAGLYITNSTIAFRSMQNGDFSAKKFGGPTGNDPDYFRVVFSGWINGMPTPAVTKYLADFRDSNNANDYIVKDWEFVNLMPLGFGVDSLTYYLESSDTGAFGMNTPAYFCVDDIMFWAESVNDVSSNTLIRIYPNPFMDNLMIANKSDEPLTYTITDNSGKRIKTFRLDSYQQEEINTAHWSRGIYFVKVSSGDATYFKKIIK